MSSRRPFLPSVQLFQPEAVEAVTPTNRNLQEACNSHEAAFIDNTSEFVTSTGAPKQSMYQTWHIPVILAAGMRKFLRSWQSQSIQQPRLRTDITRRTRPAENNTWVANTSFTRNHHGGAIQDLSLQHKETARRCDTGWGSPMNHCGATQAPSVMDHHLKKKY